MNIKQSIYTLLLFFGVSFSASANYRVTYVSPALSPFVSTGVYSSIDEIDSLVIGNCYKSSSYNYYYSYRNVDSVSSRIVYFGYATDWNSCNPATSGRNRSDYVNFESYQCPDGTELNPETHKCEELPPECEDGQIWNPDSGLCEIDDFCNSDEFLNLKVEQNMACIDANPTWLTKFVPHCEDRNNYSFDCILLTPKPWDPTPPLDSPDGDFTGGSGGTSNPKPPSFDKPDADDVQPTDTTDEAVLEAVKNANRDSNQAFNALNTDLNDGFNDVNNQLTQLNETNNAIGQTVVDQMNQDYQIYLANKELMLQQSGYIAEGTTNIVNSLESQTGSLVSTNRAIGNTLGQKLDGLTDKLSEIAPCDPNEDDRNCEGQHGLTGSIVSDINTQMNSSVGEQLDEAETQIIESTNEFTDGSFVSSVQVYLDDTVNLAMGVIPNIGDCVAFTMPSPFGGTIDFGCEFSTQVKVITSFLIYVYTLWTLIDILFNGITPVAPATTQRYYH